MSDIAELLDSATVVHLQPDDMIVLRLAVDMIITPDLAGRVREAFAPRKVVVLSSSVSIGHTDGAVHWELGS